MTKKINVIVWFSVDAAILAVSGGLMMLIFSSLTQLKDIESKSEAIIQHPYLSEVIRQEQKDLLYRSNILTSRMVQNSDQSIELIQDIEYLALSAGIELKVQLNEQQQESLGSLSLVPIQFTGHGPWDSVVHFIRTLRQQKPGFFIDQVSLSNDVKDEVQFTMNYSILWQGKL